MLTQRNLSTIPSRTCHSTRPAPVPHLPHSLRLPQLQLTSNTACHQIATKYIHLHQSHPGNTPRRRRPMQHARDPAGAPLPPQQPSSLEDQLRGMIISHQHQQQPRVQTPGAPPIRRIPSQGARQTHPAPIPNTVSYPYPVVAAAPPTIPIPFVPMPQQLQQPHLPRPTRGPGPHDAGTPRFVPKHHPSNKGVVRGGPGSRAPPGGRFPPRSSAPPPPNLDHFPPLGKETPKEKPRPLHSVVPTQHADQPRGQLRQPEVVVGPGFHNSRLFQWRPPQTHYEQFYVEQAFHLDHVAKALLEKITPPDSETSFKEELLRTLQDICKKLCPTAELIPFGSLVSTYTPVCPAVLILQVLASTCSGHAE